MLESYLQSTQALSEMEEDFTFKNEFKLIDDSYYWVYDDADYDKWRERMSTLIDMQVKQASLPTSTAEESEVSPAEGKEVSSIPPENPVKPAILNLSTTTLYSGLPPAPDIENYKFNVSLGMKYLLAEIDQKVDQTAQQTRLKAMLMDTRSGRGKWNNPSRVGQEELYPALEKVLLDLRAYTPYSIPFLVKVSKKDVPDYYDVIKKPMDLGTMSKKLKSQEYMSKQQFVDDLNLIFTNCFTYNTAEDSIYRQHVQMLKDKWTYLLKTVPEIVIGKASTLDSLQSVKRHLVSSTSTLSSGTRSKEETLDDLDSLLNTHLEGLSDLESEPSPKRSRVASPSRLQVTNVNFPGDLRDLLQLEKGKLPSRNAKLMIKYVHDLHKAAGQERESSEESQNHPFIFPEQLYFHNTVPDSQLYFIEKKPEKKPALYNTNSAFTKMYNNYQILKNIRELRKHLLECSQADPPQPETLIEQLQHMQLDDISSFSQTRSVLRKIVTLFLAQNGFELIANAALTTICELVEDYLLRLFKSLRLLGESSPERNSADIFRAGIAQAGISTLTDLEMQMTDTFACRDRFTQIFAILSEQVAAVRNGYELETTEEAGDDDGGDGEQDEAVNDEELDEELNTETVASTPGVEEEDYDG